MPGRVPSFDPAETEFFTFREGDAWICAWRRYDIVTQGATEMQACTRMMNVIACHTIDDAVDGRAPFSSTQRPSDALLAKWSAAHAAAHPIRPTLRLVR